MLFKKKAKIQPERKESTKIIGEKNFTTAKHFRGFKKRQMVVYGYPELMEANAHLKDKDLINQPIKFERISVDKIDFTQEFYRVYMYDMKIGLIFDEELVSELDNHKIDQVYAKYEGERVHLLFHSIE